MQINEIEILGASFTVRHHEISATNIELIAAKILRADQFDLEAEIPGFHDYEVKGDTIRGFYSIVVPFEVEHLADGITTKTLFKRLESCEFIITSTALFSWGKLGVMKMMASNLSAATGQHVEPKEYDFNQLYQIQAHMTMVKSVALTNPREMEIRKAKLVGIMENYESYNIVNPRNHGLESVSGMIDTPLGPMGLTVGKKGIIRLNVKKGLLLTIECLQWIVERILHETPVETGNYAEF